MKSIPERKTPRGKFLPGTAGVVEQLQGEEWIPLSFLFLESRKQWIAHARRAYGGKLRIRDKEAVLWESL